ncbi:proline hydroxylase [Noviherbaspirillum sp. 17J57-3]|uniref:Proline hydroxylase n=2 Tax=Noviherbaspirillum galbum TaxID=2709383 RepID=A0A6B3SSH8_9BURK|nr:proline hydroxylase [Noviherbaspirillum galbum]
MHNLERSCEPEGMIDIMVRDGRFERQFARAAVEEARFGAPSTEPVAIPDIDTSSNTVQTPDRRVNVVFSLKSPRIVVVGNLLSDDECDAMLAYTEQKLVRSPVVSDTDGSSAMHSHRTSRGAMLQRGETELVARIEARLAALMQWPVERGEGLQVLRYDHGNEYRPHYDWFNTEQPGPRKHLERGGQRFGTIVMYLSDVEKGGGTSFPKLGLEVQPKKGGAVFFANVDRYGAPDENTLHAGEPVVSGVKYIATKWVRERPYV